MRTNNIFKLIVSIVICELAGVIGSVFTASAISGWYAGLAKPALNPPNWVFGPVWTLLYLLMGISLYLVWKNNWKVENHILEGERKPWNYLSERFWTGSWQKGNVIAIFGIQLILNILWSFIFFGLKNPGLAFFEILALWFAILYTIINFYRVSKASAYLLLPYILWVSFAGYLNYSIWQLSLNIPMQVVKNESVGKSEMGTIRGKVSVGPICPVERIDVPCPVPPEAYTSRQIVIYKADGRTEVTRSPIHSDGTYSFALQPGSYVLDLARQEISKGSDIPHTFVVKTGATETFDFSIDTGIR